MQYSSKQKGFTLIELIITIAILAILVAVLVIAINPAEQLARARDAKRVADLDAMKTALNLYLAQATTTIDLGNAGAADSRCLGGGGSPTVFSFNSNSTSTTNFATRIASSSGGFQTVGNAGWMPARLDQTPGGAPIATLPIDPKGASDSTYYYVYVCDTTGSVEHFELNAKLESGYFTSDLDVDGTDGGGNYSGDTLAATNYASTTWYEVGNDPGLDLL